MKKFVVVGVLVCVLAGVALYVASQPRGVSVAGIDFGGSERTLLAERTREFMEDIQFKDFDKASTYHLAETREKRDIPKLLHRVFKVKHEVLDITNYEVLDVDLDNSKERARVRMQVWFRVLGDAEIRDREEARRDVEMLIYWFRQKDGAWAMELESSLRGS